MEGRREGVCGRERRECVEGVNQQDGSFFFMRERDSERWEEEEVGELLKGCRELRK